jgi:hypothetical protein
MSLNPTRLACLALLGAASAMSAQADSLASSASSAASESVGSLSASVRGSSNSSSGDKQAAVGDWRVIDVAEVADRPGLLRLRMERAEAAPAARPLWLDLPRATVEAQGLRAGARVTARARPYGLEFTRTESREAFFLVLADDWHREIDARRVEL